MRQNATMDTVWCRGQLRVIIRSIHRIRQGQPIVLNYDEYIKADGSHPYFDSDSDSMSFIIIVIIITFLLYVLTNDDGAGENEKHVPYVVNDILIPKSVVVIPYISDQNK